ncbi:MAG TPA: RNA-binding protein, partial [Saprospirales bacterium]|nr:RNA-binding protein [Saprospirales bacterium]
KGEKNIGFQEYLKKMPPIIEANYFFKNLDGEHFSNQAAAWGLGTPVVTQSAAWADFDNDGDLDLALNNTNDYAGILENKSEQTPNHWLRIQLKGNPGNPWGIGAQILAYGSGKTFYLEQNPVRGFQASVDPVLSLGLGQVAVLDSLVITWPTMERQVLTGVKSNQTLRLDIAQAQGKTLSTPPAVTPLFTDDNG